jgi:two-component system, OmpR family, sensor histidine kinase BaeS
MAMMMGGGPWLRLADVNGSIVADNRGNPGGKLTASERQAAIELHDSIGGKIGYLIAIGGNHPNSEQQLISALVKAGWIAAGIAGGLALLLALLLSYSLLRPVQELTVAAVKMAGGDLSQRVKVRSKDELGTLGDAFNHMASSIEQANQARKAMTADIAHELRTPIAIQRAHLEALQDGIYPLTVENLQPVLDQTETLTRLVEDLRTLALADAGELTLEREAVDLPLLVRRVIERFRPEAESREIQLTLAVPDEQVMEAVYVDAGRVEQIINNLLSNALRYTPERGLVEIDGPGIPEEALPRLFERFYRADKSRSRAAGGTGLGLAIARQLALAHGGELSAENRPEGGAIFRLRIPL